MLFYRRVSENAGAAPFIISVSSFIPGARRLAFYIESGIIKIMKSRFLPFILLLFLLTGTASAGCGFGADARMSAKEYFQSEDDSRAAIVINGEIAEERGIVRDGTIYLPQTLVWNDISSGFYYDAGSGALLLTLPSGTETWTENDGSGFLITDEKGAAYVAADCVSGYSDAEVQIFQEPARVVVRTEFDSVYAAETTNECTLRKEASESSLGIRTLEAGEDVVLTVRDGNWCGVNTPDGYAGYLRTEDLSISGQPGCGHETNPELIFEKVDFEGTVRMVWDYIGTADDNTYLEAMMDAAEGVNVVSPTWYAITDNGGGVSSLADLSYVERAHDMGMQVWPLLGDYSGEDENTGGILVSAGARDAIISKVIGEAEQFGFDGVNVDFEHIREENVPAYIQFIRELCAEAHKCSLIVSCDNYVPTYTAYYRRAAQMEAADYLVIMAYDEHTASSEEIGSVASLPFVIQGIEDTIQEVAPERTVLGVPFYSRGWIETFGVTGFETQALTMEGADEFMATYGIEPYWDESAGQFYGTTEDGSARYSIWKEDERSIGEKLALVSKYGLAGAAAWRLGYEAESVWPVWTQYLGN